MEENTVNEANDTILNSEPSLDNLEYKKSSGGNFTWALSSDEMDKIDGSRVEIESVKIIPDTSMYGKDSKPLPPGQERKVYVIEMITKPFGGNVLDNDVTHNEKYNLKETDDGQWIVGLHEKSKTAQFLAKYKIDNFKDVTKIENGGVVIVKRANPKKPDKPYMSISI